MIEHVHLLFLSISFDLHSKLSANAPASHQMVFEAFLWPSGQMKTAWQNGCDQTCLALCEAAWCCKGIHWQIMGFHPEGCAESYQDLPSAAARNSPVARSISAGRSSGVTTCRSWHSVYLGTKIQLKSVKWGHVSIRCHEICSNNLKHGHRI